MGQNHPPAAVAFASKGVQSVPVKDRFNKGLTKRRVESLLRSDTVFVDQVEVLVPFVAHHLTF